MSYANIPLKKQNIFRQNRNIDTKKIKNYIKILSYPKDDFIEFGSYTLSGQPYYTDIDATQDIYLSKKMITKHEAAQKSTKIVQNIVKKILNARIKTYLGDIKGGVDTFFVNNYDDNDCYKINSFNGKKCLQNIDSLLQKKYINKDSYDKLNKYVKMYATTKDLRAYAMLSDEYRKLVILRWNKDEIIKNKKKLSANRIITLDDALYQTDNLLPYNSQSKILKIDMFAFDVDKFTEITNLLGIFYLNETNRPANLTISQLSIGEENVIRGLQSEVTRYYYSLTPKFKNYIKYCKRIFSLSLKYKDRQLAELLENIFQSEYNKLYELNSEIAVMVDIYEYSLINNYKYDLVTIKRVLDGLKQKFSVILSIPNDILNYIITNIDHLVYDNIKIDKFINILDDITHMLKDFINQNVLQWLKQNNLFPINDPRYFSPNYLIFPFY